MHIYQKHSLQALNTLAVPSICDYYCEPSSIAELTNALNKAKELNLTIKVLGGGSNVLLASHLEAFIISPKIVGVKVLSESSDSALIEIGAGENWSEFIEWSVDNGFYGLENLSLIPGSVGAAPIQNIGAYGVEQKLYFEGLSAVEISTGVEAQFTVQECKFGYRDSIFKQEYRNKYIITQVRYRLKKNPNVNLSYPALQHYFSKQHDFLKQHGFSHGGGEVTPRMVADAVSEIRSHKLPNPAHIPNAGSFFKNPIVSLEKYDSLVQQYPALVGFDYPGPKNLQKKLAAGWLIDCAGWKGKRVCGVIVHSKQALVLTNPDQLPLKNVLDAENKILGDIERRFGIYLEREPQIL